MSAYRISHQCPSCGRYWQWEERAQIILDYGVNGEMGSLILKSECYRCRADRLKKEGGA